MIAIQIKEIKSHSNQKVVSGSYVNPDEVIYFFHKEPDKKWDSSETTFVFKNGDEMVLEKEHALYFKELGQIGAVKFDQNKMNEIQGVGKTTSLDGKVWNRKW